MLSLNIYVNKRVFFAGKNINVFKYAKSNNNVPRQQKFRRTILLKADLH